jgi:hypothetical protein
MKAEKPLAATPVEAIVMRPLRAFACRLSVHCFVRLLLAIKRQ